MNKYKERLLQEWRQHGKIVIATDFDDTLFPWKFKSKEDSIDFERTIRVLKLAKETGAYIVIFSACDEDRYGEIRKYCEWLKLPIDSINVNPIDLPYGKKNKIYANIFIDDRAGITEALDTLEQCMYIIRGEQHSKDLDIWFG